MAGVSGIRCGTRVQHRYSDRTTSAAPKQVHRRDTAVAIKMARQANDQLAKEVSARPRHYGGFAHLAMQEGLVVRNDEADSH